MQRTDQDALRDEIRELRRYLRDFAMPLKHDNGDLDDRTVNDLITTAVRDEIVSAVAVIASAGFVVLLLVRLTEQRL